MAAGRGARAGHPRRPTGIQRPLARLVEGGARSRARGARRSSCSRCSTSARATSRRRSAEHAPARVGAAQRARRRAVPRAGRARVADVDGPHNAGVHGHRPDAGAHGRGLREHRRAAARAAGSTSTRTIELLREQLAAGWRSRQIVVDLVLDQIAAQAGRGAGSRRCSRRFRQFPADIVAADQHRLRAAGARRVREQFAPSWKRLETFLRDTYRPQARPQIALTSLPDGRKLYASLFASTRRRDDGRARSTRSACRRWRASSARWSRSRAPTASPVPPPSTSGSWASGRRCASRAGGDDRLRARRAGARRAGAAAAVQAPAEDGGRRPADSAGSRGVDRVELRGGTTDGTRPAGST